MIKLYRKKKKNSLKNGKTKKYLKYAIGETALLVIGILIALYIDNLNTKRVNKIKERASYESLKRHLEDDKSLITYQRDVNKATYDKYSYAIQLIEENDRTKLEVLEKITLELYYVISFDRKGNIYQNLINTGESKLMRNKEILKGVQQLEEKYISLNRMGNIHLESLYDVSSDIKKSFKLEDLTARDVDYVYSIDFQNHFSLIRYIAGEKGKIYNAAIDKIDEITALIDQELNSKV